MSTDAAAMPNRGRVGSPAGVAPPRPGDLILKANDHVNNNKNPI